MRRLLWLVAVLPLLLLGCISLPEGLNVHISETGTLPDGTAPYGGVYPANYYWPPTRTLVLAPNVGALTKWHETCHAHQHQMILDTEANVSVDLREWYDTDEGRSFAETFGWLPDGGMGMWGPTFYPTAHPWQTLSVQNPLEDFANTCAFYLLEPNTLAERDLGRYAWAEEWLS